VQEGLDALRDVIYHIETYDDVTSIRASTPMYLMMRRIKAMGIKMVLTGEGADEVFGGYVYFHKAPGAREFHEETIRKLDLLQIRLPSCQQGRGRVGRRDPRAVSGSRVPRRRDGVRSPREDGWPGSDGKVSVAKSVRKYLPEEILWRQKEQFSDGVGYRWIDSLKAVAEAQVSDSQMQSAHYRFPYNPRPPKRRASTGRFSSRISPVRLRLPAFPEARASPAARPQPLPGTRASRRTPTRQAARCSASIRMRTLARA
jgi:asparagine synthase (glutamine-hydrolysing)